MNIKQFKETIVEQLKRLKGNVQVEVTACRSGHLVTLSIDSKQYEVSKAYSDSDVDLHSQALIRVQTKNLYEQLIQKVLDRNLGPGELYVIR